MIDRDRGIIDRIVKKSPIFLEKGDRPTFLTHFCANRPACHPSIRILDFFPLCDQKSLYLHQSLIDLHDFFFKIG